MIVNQLNKDRHLDVFRKRLCAGATNHGSSSESMSEDETTHEVRSNRVASATSNTSSLHSLQNDRHSSVSDGPHLTSLRDEIFVPKSSRLNLTPKNKSKFDETILASAAFTAATEPVDVQNEVRWFEGELPTKPYEEIDKSTVLRNNHTESSPRPRRPSKESISSTSTIESLTYDSKSNEGKNVPELAEHERKKKLGHYRSKSDQFRRFRPFGTTMQPAYGTRENGSKMDVDPISSSLPTNSDVAG